MYIFWQNLMEGKILVSKRESTTMKFLSLFLNSHGQLLLSKDSWTAKIEREKNKITLNIHFNHEHEILLLVSGFIRSNEREKEIREERASGKEFLLFYSAMFGMALYANNEKSKINVWKNSHIAKAILCAIGNCIELIKIVCNVDKYFKHNIDHENEKRRIEKQLNW